MKKIIFLLMVIFLSTTHVARAHEHDDNADEAQEGVTKEEGKGHHGVHKMMGMMKMGIQKPQMVASNDGGVILLSGSKLYKYDKNLNLVKEVELKSEEVKGMCPMCHMMKHKGKMKKEINDKVETTSEGATGHEGHQH